jgi:hypothetical protein
MAGDSVRMAVGADGASIGPSQNELFDSIRSDNLDLLYLFL